MNPPLVSVIIPAYKAEKTIARAVNSVLTQDYPSLEIVVVSDDAQDYAAVLESLGINDARIHTYIAEGTRNGPGKVKNIALEHAKGEFIAPLDSDDAFHPGFLEKLVPLANAYGAAFTRLNHYDGDTGNIIKELQTQPDNTVMMQPGDFLRTSGWQTVFRNSGAAVWWDEATWQAEDVLHDFRLFDLYPQIPLAYRLYDYYHYPSSMSHEECSIQGFINSYERMLERLHDANDRLGIMSPVLSELFAKEIKHRLEMNQECLRMKKLGEVRDFYDFIRKRPDLFPL